MIAWLARLIPPVPASDPAAHTRGTIIDDYGHDGGTGCTYCQNPWPCPTARKAGHA